uniref:Pentatricopeptide repeat-containing protein n=1 Tax=Hordeum vulgare subsp. vulgare TaxID=112509 RepID=A0A8I6XUR1_HORVV
MDSHQKGLVDRAIEVFEQMPKYGSTTNIFTYNSLINGFSEQGHLNDARKLLSTMSWKPGAISYNSTLKGSHRAEQWMEAEEVVAEMLRKKCPLKEITFNYANLLFIPNRVT